MLSCVKNSSSEEATRRRLLKQEQALMGTALGPGAAGQGCGSRTEGGAWAFPQAGARERQ